VNAPERLCGELDTLLSDICFSGLKNVHPEILEKLTLLEGTAKELGMERGAVLISQFAASLVNYRLAGNSPSAASRGTAASGKNEDALTLLCALDFYNKNLMGAA
jgi:hypothetical protein